MPELPEVEIVRRGLAPSMEGAVFAGVTLNRANLRFPFDDGFVDRIRGARVTGLKRRAKYIVAQLDNGLSLSMHLGMTGRFSIENEMREPRTPGSFYYGGEADPRHDHVIFHMSGGTTIRYNDARRFGFMTLFESTSMASHPLFANLGAEPLSCAFTPMYLRRRAEAKTQALKGFLLDQRIIAGLGNIYVCEALFRAGLSPLAEADALTRGRRGTAAAAKLCGSIRAVLTDAIAAGGSSFRDYRHADGGTGAFQDRFDVYGRAGETCHGGCGSSVERIVQQGRSTFFCAKCQRGP